MPRVENSGDTAGLELTVLMPCLNEVETVGTCVAKAVGYLESAGIDGEVLVADNGSDDGSQEAAVAAGARVLEVAERGYGAALQAGFAVARGRFVIMGDADDSYDFSDLGAFVAKLREGYDLVMGDRFAGPDLPGAMPWLHRHMGTPLLSWIGRLFFKSPIRDFQCGLRGFRKEALAGIGFHTFGMEFATEMVVKASLEDLRITEVPITLYPSGRTRAPHLRTWSDGWRNLRFLLLFSPQWLFLYPGLVLVVVGLAAGLWLLPGPRPVGDVTFDVATLLYASLALTIGVQAVLLAVLMRVFAVSSGLLPERPGFSRFAARLDMEKGLIGGGLCTIAGLIVSIVALRFWGEHSFGPLDLTRSLRLVIPGVTLVAVGCQICLGSLVLGMFKLRRR